MSLDNVLGVAAAAHGSEALLIAGLAISIPLIVFGSAVILRLMDRFPAVITVGAALIGYVAGEMLVSDAVVVEYVPASLQDRVETVAALSGAALVVALGIWLGRRVKQQAGVIDADGGAGRT
jgi:predicted tellurium resistance membrane protein TerC